MEWRQVELDAGKISAGAYHALCRRFQRAFIHAGAPQTMALFTGMTPQGGRMVYFTPECTGLVQELLEEHAARPCGRPRAGTVTLIYGVPGVEQLLLYDPPLPVFPEPCSRPDARQFRPAAA